MEDKKLKQTFIIDIASIRGSQDEVKQLDIQQQFNQISDEFNNSPLLIQILTAMIIKINDEYDEKANIVLYSGWENRYSIDTKSMVDQRFESDNIKVVVGQQSLFYLLGKMNNEMASVRWLSKERLFFSQSFLQSKDIVENGFELKVYSLFQFEDAVKHLIIELFILKKINIFYKSLINL